MKRLVVCCDGTWKRADDVNVSNIEKIARAVNTSPIDGPQQVVHYSSGVGTGATLAERMLGGALGLGLDEAILGAYRFLALNYEQGDEIYIFGFSRGAYTARSLAGMISSVGLLTPVGVARNCLCDAIDTYRNRPHDKQTPEANAASRRDVENFRSWCYDEGTVAITFLGVFDTVGAMGVPGMTMGKYRFHAVDVPTQVETARQALAIDERRRRFEPCLWTTSDANSTTDVEQVWFDGVHSDIGGGYRESTLSDLSLMWMIGEAQERGLVFRDDLYYGNLQPSNMPTLHDSMSLGFRIVNVIGAVSATVASLLHRRTTRFHKGRRIFELAGSERSKADWNVRIARTAYDRSGNVDPIPSLAVAPNAKLWIDWMTDEFGEDGIPIEDVPAWPAYRTLHAVRPRDDSRRPTNRRRKSS